MKSKDRNDDAALVLKFKGFTTYFGGFNENRRNMYSAEEKATAIAYRIVHENLPKFISNMKTFQRLSENHQIDFSEVETQMKDELDGNKLQDVFSLAYFNHCLTQSGIDRYNAVLGGKTNKKGNKIQGINEKINLFRQKKNLKSKDAPVLAPLYKQILSDRVSTSFLPENFETAKELIKSIWEFYKEGINGFIKNNEKKNVINEIESLFSRKLNPTDCDLSQIYIRNAFITAVSQQIFGSYSVITSALNAFIDKTYNTKKEKEKQQKKSYFSIAEIEAALKAYLQETEIENKEKREEFLKQANPILQYFNSLSISIELNDKKEKANVVTHFRQKHEAVQSVLNKAYESNNELIQDKKTVAVIKDYLDSYLHILRFVKPFFVAPPERKGAEMPDKDAFYSEFDEMFEELKSVTPLYNKVRDFLTQKPYSTEKIKLNFENVSLLSGWDVNKETDNTSVIFRKDSLYYLGIMNKKDNKVFHDIPASSDNDFYEKMNYKLLPGANKMLPKVIFSDRWIEYFNPSKELIEKYEKGSHKKGEIFSLSDCHALIDFFKTSIKKHEDWKQFGFQFSPTETYQDISGFYREVEHQGYKISFQNISAKYIHQLVSDGKLFLFKIYNKDFSPHSKGKPNLHTLYWKAAFDDANLKDVVFKLNGEAEVFYRPQSILEKSKVVHGKNKPIDNKNPNNTKKQSRFEYEIVKDKRYTKDKYHFHVPITLNFKSGDIFKFNDLVNETLKENFPNINIIGIDRGERHLVYYSLINSKGEILKQDSFNIVKNEYNGTKYETDYQASLVEKEKARDAARKSWDAIGKIKELKEGYLSQVVHKIARMMIEHNAIVVLEDLNFGFKRGRMKVERQVYQKLEKMLIDKLNYLVFKDREAAAPGGVLNAYQLAAPFTSFKDMGKQTGFIFYVPAANTSKIDFATGFVNLLYPKYENEKQAKEFFGKFETIRYNPDKKYFEFVAKYNNFVADEKAKLENDREWTICTYGKERYQYQPATKTYNPIDVTKCLQGLMDREQHKIHYDQGNDLKNNILSINNAQFFKDLIFYLRLVLQMRYTDGKGRDFILSPVANNEGVFFNSENAKENEPKDADANGAYHIALKGLLQLQKIRTGEKKLAISNKEWHDFVQERNNKK
ncbi:MAG: type V CRISPR-associated protein Cas12a/Cpf1 [Deltaproteobacteria bacterium]|nr:type V CRISPR-associated protein Cas12a/Cpf1 [Deltaproteobacteria bacterium]